MSTDQPRGRADDEWAAQLPAALAECATRWDLVLGERLPGGLVGHVVACTTRTGEAAALKLNPPAAAEFAGTPEQEAAALRAWGGRGAVELLAFAPELRALLTRRAVPGTPLGAGGEQRARREVASVLALLFEASASPADFAPLAEAVDRYLAAKLGISDDASLEPLVQEARVSARRLAAPAPHDVLLHGDVMDKNLLRDGSRLVAIDPMPHVGDPHSDVGFWAATRSPTRGLDARAAEVARLLGLDSGRAARWAAVYAVGEACESWRRDKVELRAWVQSPHARDLLAA